MSDQKRINPITPYLTKLHDQFDRVQLNGSKLEELALELKVSFSGGGTWSSHKDLEKIAWLIRLHLTL